MSMFLANYRNKSTGKGAGGACVPYFLQSLVFCSPFEELQTELFEVELIINNTSLTYVDSNTIRICLSPNHLIFGRQLLYSSNKTSSVITNLTVLSSTTDKINSIINHFWDRGRHEYVINLCETQQTSKLNKNSKFINPKLMLMKLC